MVVFLSAFLLIAPGAHAIGIAVGGYGGVNVPIVQDDAGLGPLFGLKAKLGGTLPVTIEPFFTMITEGDVEHSEEGIDFTQEGGSIQSFGVDVAFGSYRGSPGMKLYLVGGIGAYGRDPGQEYRDKETRFGFDLGLGLVSKFAPMLDLDISARLIVFTLEDGGSRKSAGIAAGLNYYFTP
jgi:hypothetical protein